MSWQTCIHGLNPILDLNILFLPHPILPLRECQDSKEEEYVIGTYGDIFRQVYYSLEHVNGCVNIK